MLPLFALLKFHHIGIAVDSIEKALPTYHKLGYRSSEPVHDPLQHVYLVSCHLGDFSVELVEPIDEHSPCFEFLKRNGPGTYHVCYECKSIAETIIHLKKQGIRFKVASSEKTTTLFQNAKVAFLYVFEIGLIELIEYLSNKNAKEGSCE